MPWSLPSWGNYGKQTANAKLLWETFKLGNLKEEMGVRSEIANWSRQLANALLRGESEKYCNEILQRINENMVHVNDDDLLA